MWSQLRVFSNPGGRPRARRKDNEIELNAFIEAWTKNQAPEDVMILLQSRGISAGVVENSRDLLQDPQLKSRGFLKQLDIGDGERMSHMGLGFQLSKTPYETLSPGPNLGENTEQICREILKMGDMEFIDLINTGALS